MCGGASNTQNELQDEQAQFYATQIQAYNNAYANYTQLQNTLTQQFAPVLAAGPGQAGYTAPELTALQTEAKQGTATNFNQAEQAANAAINARGGGNDTTNITSGSAQELEGSIASTAAATESAEELGITQSDYVLGHQNYENAVAGTEEVASGWNPNSFAGSTVSAGNSADAEANAVAEENNSVWSNVLGALGGVAGAAVGNGGALTKLIP
jgi:NADH dehydrogenase/NADH:ubiquinone oxidoreductase subunit G